jgi:pimeloyl-ACP methyl ester carboxylesterase
MHQLARCRGRLVAAGHFVAVCIDGQGRTTDVPAALTDALGVRPSLPGPVPRHAPLNDTRIAYEETGDGTALLFIHGFPLDRTMWRWLVPLVPGYHRIVPDLPGFGSSDALSEPATTMREYADAMARLLDYLRVERAVVCGLSMGGYVAFEMLRHHRHRVAGLVLMNTRAEPDAPDARRGRDRTADEVGRAGLDALVSAMLPRLLAPATAETRPEIREHVRTMILDNQVAGMVAALRAMRDRADSAPLLGSLGVPVLVVAGAEDAVIPATAARAMADAIPGARYEVIPGAGHVTPLEAPDLTGRALRQFLEFL